MPSYESVINFSLKLTELPLICGFYSLSSKVKNPKVIVWDVLSDYGASRTPDSQEHLQRHLSTLLSPTPCPLFSFISSQVQFVLFIYSRVRGTSIKHDLCMRSVPSKKSGSPSLRLLIVNSSSAWTKRCIAGEILFLSL